MHKKHVIVILCLPLILAALVLLFWQYLPYQFLAARQIKHALADYGLEAASLTVEKLSAEEAVLTGIELESSKLPLRIGRLAAQYRLGEIRRGKLDHLKAEKIEGGIYKTGQGWQPGGLENLRVPTSGKKEGSLLYDAKTMHDTLPDKITIQEGLFKIQAEEKIYVLPFSLNFEQEPLIKLGIATKQIKVEGDPYTLHSGPAELFAVFDEKQKRWEGNAETNSLQVTGLSLPVPPLKVQADYNYGDKGLHAYLRAFNADQTYKTDWEFSLPAGNAKQGMLLVKYLQIPWGGGRIILESLRLPLAMDKPVLARIQLHEVQLATLLGEISSGRIKGTGKISGVLPVTYHPDGRITVEQGIAQALEAGTISVSADLLPGESQQLAFTRDTLQNFHYTRLQIGVSSPDGTRSAVHLMLEGRNPNSAEKRPVKLNINLTGDIIPLVQQSLLPIHDARKLLNSQDTP